MAGARPLLAAFWLCLCLFTLLLVASYPVGDASLLLPRGWLWGISLLPFPLIFCAFAWCGPLWGLGAAAWTIGAVAVAGLASGEFSLMALPAMLALFSLLVHRGVEARRGELRERTLRVERIREQINTRREEARRLEELQAAAEQRLSRYQQLRRIANAFNLSLPLDELMECIIAATGELIRGADHVLLYLVDPETLQLELKQVWRRSGSFTVKAKRGDPFDHWVMRQAQPLLVEDAARDFRFPRPGPDGMGRPFGSVLAVPLVSRDRFLGVLRLESAGPKGLGSDDLRLVRILGDLASLGVENSHLYSRMLQLAVTDDLTGLAVREFFEKRLAEEAARVGRSGRRLSVLLIDIDRFKGYNDQFGHSAGDKLLKQIGGILTQLKRPSEVAARYGGEEFVLLLPGASREQALRRAEEIRVRVEATPVELRREVTRITVSIGLAVFPEDGSTREALLAASDRRLYQAKAQGRNRVCCEE